MTPEVAGIIVKDLNHPKIIDALIAYMDDRIEMLRNQLEKEINDRRVHELQGALQEIRRLKSLRENALAVVDIERKK